MGVHIKFMSMVLTLKNVHAYYTIKHNNHMYMQIPHKNNKTFLNNTSKVKYQEKHYCTKRKQNPLKVSWLFVVNLAIKTTP